METLYLHSAQVKDKPRVTVAGIVVDGTLRIGVARCSQKDVYIRKKGNVMAEGRAKSKAYCYLFPLKEGEDTIRQFIGIANTIIEQQGGIVKPRKKSTETTVSEEEKAVSQHN